MSKGVDKIFLGIVGALVLGGFFIFSSASMGFVAKEGVKFSSVIFNQFFLGIFLGGIAMFICSKIDYRLWKKYSFFIFIFAMILTILVFIPKLGFEHGGARRWLSLGPFSFQPSEFLKFGAVLYLASWLSLPKHKIKTLKFGVMPLVIISAIVSLLLFLQPDTGTLLVLIATFGAMFVIAGASWKHIFSALLVGITSFSILVLSKPYILERLKTFINPASDPTGASWQIQQSLIAIGSGKIFGKGFGQSIQKFNFLPEPIGDSIFAVTAEEFGFIGSIIVLTLFCTFLFRGIKISANAPNRFGGLLVSGIVILIVVQSLINIASMVGVFPLTGLPLLFISHGGTAMLFALAEVGIILNVSKYIK